MVVSLQLGKVMTFLLLVVYKGFLREYWIFTTSRQWSKSKLALGKASSLCYELCFVSLTDFSDLLQMSSQTAK